MENLSMVTFLAENAFKHRALARVELPVTANQKRNDRRPHKKSLLDVDKAGND